MEKNMITVAFEARPENQGFARSAAASYCSMADPTMEELTEVKTAVSEAVSNAILHGYERKGEGKIIMELQFLEGNKLWVRVTDEGKGITDIDKARTPLFSTGTDMEMSGMGFTVMESFMDKVFVESAPGKGTSVTLIKCLDLYDGI